MNWQKYCNPLHWHPAANLLPRINENGNTDAIATLADDIATHGLLHPIVLLNGKVLDGRNRLMACKLKGIQLTTMNFTQFKPNGLSPEQFVYSNNLHRRQLTLDQRAAIAAELVPQYQEEAQTRVGGRPRKDRKPSASVRAVKGKSSELAAKFVGGVSTRTVENVLKLERKATEIGKPGILKRIKAGRLTIAGAQHEIDMLFYRGSLYTQYKAKPLTVFDTREGDWIKQKEYWRSIGAFGGHNEQLNGGTYGASDMKEVRPTSAFDPVLAEFVCRSFCPDGGRILDPFAGEAVKGIVAAKLGFDYLGVDSNESQIATNIRQAQKVGVKPKWVHGDSAKLDKVLRGAADFDLIFTSPPYFDLEIYSNDRKDGSALPSYTAFMQWYRDIFRQAITHLKPNRFLVLKVGEIRDEKGFCRNFVGDTITCFLRLGLNYYNEAILHTAETTAAARVAGQFPNYRKLVHTHQNVLCFFKGNDPKCIPGELGLLEPGETRRNAQRR